MDIEVGGQDEFVWEIQLQHTGCIYTQAAIVILCLQLTASFLGCKIVFVAFLVFGTIIRGSSPNANYHRVDEVCVGDPSHTGLYTLPH